MNALIELRWGNRHGSGPKAFYSQSPGCKLQDVVQPILYDPSIASTGWRNMILTLRRRGYRDCCWLWSDMHGVFPAWHVPKVAGSPLFVYIRGVGPHGSQRLLQLLRKPPVGRDWIRIAVIGAMPGPSIEFTHQGRPWFACPRPAAKIIIAVVAFVISRIPLTLVLTSFARWY